jgi:hypothetical protein
MSVHVYVVLLVVCLFLSLVLLWRLCWLHLQPSHSRRGAIHSTVHRLLKPRTPRDCPACCLSCTHASVVEPVPAPVRPWREVKSRRGAPKRVNTASYACPNAQCPYFGITDAQIHALVGDGKHGRTERIQTFRGPACHITFSARRHTPLYHLKTPSQQVAVVFSALAEGLDASAAERIFGYRQATITTWLTRAGQHAQTLHERFSSHLRLPHLQLDHCCAPGCAVPDRCSGCGWPSTLARSFFPCSLWVLAHKTRLIRSSIPCDSSWLLAAFLSSRVTA